ncbi:MAG: hypothetical protein WBG24_17440 [Syntrophobacteria bacterium]
MTRGRGATETRRGGQHAEKKGGHGLRPLRQAPRDYARDRQGRQAQGLG